MEGFKYGFTIPTGGATVSFVGLHNPTASAVTGIVVLGNQNIGNNSSGATFGLHLLAGDTVPVAGRWINTPTAITGLK
jgi:hypothetical protein